MKLFNENGDFIFNMATLTAVSKANEKIKERAFKLLDNRNLEVEEKTRGFSPYNEQIDIGTDYISLSWEESWPFGGHEYGSDNIPTFWLTLTDEEVDKEIQTLKDKREKEKAEEQQKEKESKEKRERETLEKLKQKYEGK